jgi:hypothetical protein
LCSEAWGAGGPLRDPSGPYLEGMVPGPLRDPCGPDLRDSRLGRFWGWGTLRGPMALPRVFPRGHFAMRVFACSFPREVWGRGFWPRSWGNQALPSRGFSFSTPVCQCRRRHRRPLEAHRAGTNHIGGQWGLFLSPYWPHPTSEITVGNSGLPACSPYLGFLHSLRLFSCLPLPHLCSGRGSDLSLGGIEGASS